MGFKKYLKDRITYIIIYYLSILLVIFIMMLDLIIRKEKLSISSIKIGKEKNSKLYRIFLCGKLGN